MLLDRKELVVFQYLLCAEDIKRSMLITFIQNTRHLITTTLCAFAKAASSLFRGQMHEKCLNCRRVNFLQVVLHYAATVTQGKGSIRIYMFEQQYPWFTATLLFQQRRVSEGFRAPQRKGRELYNRWRSSPIREIFFIWTSWAEHPSFVYRIFGIFFNVPPTFSFWI